MKIIEMVFSEVFLIDFLFVMFSMSFLTFYSFNANCGLVESISRHFKDEEMLRRSTVRFDQEKISD